jgi:hypothetical protein
MVFNATFNNISFISLWSVFTGDGNQVTWRKSAICRKSLVIILYTELEMHW